MSEYQTQTKRFQTIREAAKSTGLPEYRVRTMAKNGTAPGFFAGNRFYVDVPQFGETLAELSAERGHVKRAEG